MTAPTRDAAPPAAGTPGLPPDESGGSAAPPPDRPRRRGVWIALAAVTAFVVVAPSCLQMWGRAIRQSSEGSKVYRQPISEIRVNSGAATLALGPGRDGQVTVRRQLRWSLDRPHVQVAVAGEVMTVDFSCEGRSQLFSSLDCEGDLDLRVPAGVRLRISSGSGEVGVGGLSGDLDLRTGSGAANLTGLSGPVHFSAGSGEVKGTRLATPELTGRIHSGRMDLGFAAPPRRVTATSGSGEVRIGVPRGSYYRVLARSSAGGSHVNGALVDQDAPAMISVQSGSGSTWVDYTGAG
ncbi:MULTISPECIES: hypothetical protein [Thermomonosporaceae]|uniref:hypothetical protein n=1 Tax=Thermomonosporaceae TaxID=2012 RepID=UPI00255B1F3C|nr:MULTISPECIES: hypothetical protein [Thermomonosporaceae]MDL4775108.1 hypothetical protein [Actinomadura xylanilytica]